VGQSLPPIEQRDPVAWQGRPDGKPYVTGTQSGRRWPVEASQLLEMVVARRSGLIICGPETALSAERNRAITQFAQQLGWPVLADPLSGMRSQLNGEAVIIDNYDAFLRDSGVIENLGPEFVLRFGAMPTSKPLLLFLKRHSNAETWLVDSGDGWEDPTALVSEVLHVDPTAFCQEAMRELDGFTPAPGWLQSWQMVAERTAEVIDRELRECRELSEGKVFAELSRLLPGNATLYVGNSMPVRDLDTFFHGSSKNIRILGNRGANGIDGVVSSALGASVTSSAPTVLVLGDISFYHDMNGLLAAKLHKLNATIIVLNNDGGGIFSFLPQAGFPENFEELFGTPHGLDFRPAAEMYGANWRRVSDWDEFRSALTAATQSSGLNLIEVPTDRAKNVTQHREIWAALSNELATLDYLQAEAKVS
jgi:2-succinyl-5-enolpyruvyl-6-hydroxy-3-cyclohexene-1-carboxylate synthase